MTRLYAATGDERIIPALLRYARYLGQTLATQPLHNWARARAADQIDTLFWLYNRTGETFLLEVADALERQANRWIAFFSGVCIVMAGTGGGTSWTSGGTSSRLL